MGSVRKSSWRPYLLYLGLNIVVSAATVLIVLSMWEGRARRVEPAATPTADVVASVASAVPTITPTKVPSPTPNTYTVRVGDTLSDIAELFGITVEELMAANRLTDPDSLSAGQVLKIPEVEVGEGGTSRATPEPTETTAPQAQIVISGLEGAGDLEKESVRLLNQGGEVSMEGWKLEDGQGHTYIFPAFTFYGTGAVEIHTRTGTNTTIDLYWGLDQAVWTPGKVIYLRDAQGTLVSRFQVPGN